MSDPQTKEDLARAVSRNLEETGTQLHGVYSPLWASRVEVLKIIVTLSSASIVLSVTFSSSLRGIHAASIWSYVIVFSFIMFVTSLILAFVALWLGTRLYHMQPAILQERSAIQAAVLRASSRDELFKSSDEIMSRSLKPITRYDNIAAWLFLISSTCFCLAIISLAVVGAVQLLSKPTP